MKRSDQFIVLTRRLRDRLVEQGLARADQIEVVPCCVDFKRFEATRDNGGERPPGASYASGQKNGSEPTETGRFELVSAGSVTGLYLLAEMGRFFLAVKRQRPDAFLRILTMSSPASAAATLEGVGLSREDFWIGAVKPSEVPLYLRRARLGLSFRKATFSQIAASPTKIPEYLAAGLPVVCNAGIGDTDELLTRERVGIIVGDFDERSLDEAARAALSLAADTEAATRCVQAAHRYFDLESVGGAGYRNAYRRLAREQAGALVVSETP